MLSLTSQNVESVKEKNMIRLQYRNLVILKNFLKRKIIIIVNDFHNDPKNSHLEKTGKSPINPTKMNKLIAWRKIKALF